MSSFKEVMEAVDKAREESHNGVAIQVHYEMVELHTLGGHVYIRADRITTICPAPMPKESGGKTMIITEDKQYFWTDESQESIAKKVKDARLFVIQQREIPIE